MLSAFHAVPGVYPGSCLGSSDVSGAALPPRIDFCIVDTFACPRVTSNHFYSPHFGSHVFRSDGVLTLLPQVQLPRETNSVLWNASPPVDAGGRLALSARQGVENGRASAGRDDSRTCLARSDSPISGADRDRGNSLTYSADQKPIVL